MSLVRNYHNTKFKIHSTYSTTKRIPKIVLMVSLHSNSFMYLQFSLEDNFTAVGHNVLPLPARNTLLQLGQLSKRLLSRLATRTISERQGSQSQIQGHDNATEVPTCGRPRFVFGQVFPRGSSTRGRWRNRRWRASPGAGRAWPPPAPGCPCPP